MHRVPSGCDFSTTPRPQCDLLEAAGSACPVRIVRSGLGVLITMTVAAMMLNIPTNALAQTAEADKEAAEKAKIEAEKSPEQQELERRAQIDSRQRENENRRSGRDPRTGATGRVVPPNAANESKRFAPPAPVAGKPTPQPAGAAATGMQVPPPSATSAPGAKPPANAPAIAQPQPAAGTHAQPITTGGLKGDYFTFSSFSEPIDLAELVDFVQAEFDLQIIKTDAGLRGQTVVMSTPITLHKDDVVRFLVTLLELRDYTMIRDRSGVYIIQDKNRPVSGIASGELSPTRIIPTPGIRPSSLTAVITGLVTNARGGGVAGQPLPQNSVSFLDDIGVIVINEAPRVTRVVEDFVTQLVNERTQVKLHRITVTNIAASSAKERILELLGVATRTVGAVPNQPVQQPQAVPTGTYSGSLSNLSDRLVIEPGSNSLIFRGREDEKQQVEELLSMVDVIGTLLTQWYPVGNATTDAVAAEGRRQQLGDSVTFEPNDGSTGTTGFNNNRAPGQNAGIPNLQGGTTEVAGSGFILYPESGGFVYRGTPEQHHRVVGLIEQLRDLSRSEEIVYEFYKLKHGQSDEIAETLQALITSTQAASSSPLLGNNLGNRNARDDRNNRNNRNNRNQPQQPAAQNSTAGLSGEGSVGEIDGEEVFVTADEPNNQIVVKAPLKLQPQIKRLIEKLDLRRPQVYIEAMIVTVSDSENFRLAAEAQGIIGQWAFNTNFGLGSLTTSSGGTTPTTSGGITSRKNVETDLAGLTTAIVRSKDVPLVVTALQNNTSARIVARPQLLIDDNVEAEVQSRDQQPTTESNIGTSTTSTSFSGYEGAGPKLRVKPQISEGGYLKLEYEVEISSFEGDPASAGVPPAKQENTISSESVTVPGDMTIVVGGLTQQSRSDVVIKVPLLGDIPLVGHLFRDTRKNERNITFFVFITPKIMRDPSFADLRLLTRGPLDLVDLEDDTPDPIAESSEILDPRWIRPDGSTELDSPATGTIPGSMPVRRIERTPADVLPPEQSRPAPTRSSHQPPVRPPVVAPEPHPDVPPPAAEESTYEDPSVKIEDVPAGR